MDNESASGSDEEGLEWHERRAWRDVKPIPQTADSLQVAQILYDADFSKTMDYFRAMLRLDERSARALELTRRVIQGNAANYTAWHFRRLCLEALHSDMSAELAFVTRAALASPKTYQIWYHRRVVVERLGDASHEKAFTERVLADDSKNYHAWSHRQFVLQHFGLWEGELQFVEGLLDDDVRNNSAWNQRWFVVKSTTGYEAPGVMQRELDFAMRYARQAPNNESPVNYIRGIMRLPSFDADALDVVTKFVLDLLASLAEAAPDAGASKEHPEHPNARHPPPLLGLLVDVHSRCGKVSDAMALCDELASKHDTIRSKYWMYRKEKISSA